MKLVNQANKGFKGPCIVQVKRFKQEEAVKMAKDQTATFKLRTNPSDEKSQTYELTVPYFKQGSPEAWLKN